MLARDCPSLPIGGVAASLVAAVAPSPGGLTAAVASRTAVVALPP